ncbi:MAG: S8 family serine peptidase, partial [Bacteroidota bacterium]
MPGTLRIAAGVLERYPLSGQIVWRGKITDDSAGKLYEVTVDERGHAVNSAALEQVESEARSAKYGKMEPRLFYLLQAWEPEQTVKVLLWLSGIDHKRVNEELAQRYPQVKAYRFASGQPVDEQGRTIPVEPQLFEQIRTEYNRLLDQAHLETAEPVVAFLKARGYEAKALTAFPGVVAELPVHVVLEMNRTPLTNLTAIYWGEIEIRPQLDSVAGTIRVASAWNAGYTGQGVRIGVMEGGVINPNITHRALQGKIIAVNVNEATDRHAALVAGVIAGNHPNFPQYRGVAYGSNLLVSARVFNDWQNIADGLNWIINQQAFVVNASISTAGTLTMLPEDRAFDYVVRLRDPTVVVAAGNNVGDQWGWNTRSPAKGYNIITVGGFDDHNDFQWNDTMWDNSAYVDPYIDGQDHAGDREKPEVVAVGVSVTTVDIDGGDDGFSSFDGTSVATPQVSGLAALLVQRYFWLRTNPEAVKAIIMASAIHNIEGYSRLSEKDGAGAIDVASALSIFSNGGWGYKIIHDITDPNDPSNPFDDSGDYHDFTGADFIMGSTYAHANERVRAVICWDSNPAADYSTDPLSTDLDLRVISPSGNVTVASLSFN